MAKAFTSTLERRSASSSLVLLLRHVCTLLLLLPASMFYMKLSVNLFFDTELQQQRCGSC